MGVPPIPQPLRVHSQAGVALAVSVRRIVDIGAAFIGADHVPRSVSRARWGHLFVSRVLGTPVPRDLGFQTPYAIHGLNSRPACRPAATHLVRSCCDVGHRTRLLDGTAATTRTNRQA